jgi:hypothetical protein
MSENVSIREIAWRQYNVGRPASFFIRIVGILVLDVVLSRLKDYLLWQSSCNFVFQ